MNEKIRMFKIRLYVVPEVREEELQQREGVVIDDIDLPDELPPIMQRRNSRRPAYVVVGGTGAGYGGSVRSNVIQKDRKVIDSNSLTPKLKQSIRQQLHEAKNETMKKNHINLNLNNDGNDLPIKSVFESPRIQKLAINLQERMMERRLLSKASRNDDNDNNISTDSSNLHFCNGDVTPRKMIRNENHNNVGGSLSPIFEIPSPRIVSTPNEGFKSGKLLEKNKISVRVNNSPKNVNVCRAVSYRTSPINGDSNRKVNNAVLIDQGNDGSDNPKNDGNDVDGVNSIPEGNCGLQSSINAGNLNNNNSVILRKNNKLNRYRIMNDDLLLAVVSWMLCYIVLRRRQRWCRWRNRRWWVRPLNVNRPHQGAYDHLFQELKQDHDLFFWYTRMDIPTFNNLLHMVEPHLRKSSPRALPTELRLAIILRYFATADLIISIALQYRIGESTAKAIIKETSQVLIHVLSPIYLRQPTEEEWKTVMIGFLEQWNFPNCTGAIDGKHIVIQAPSNSGSQYFNYKKTFSIVLLAVCNANYKLTLVHIGEMGSNSDAGIFSNSSIAQLLGRRQLGLPNGTAQLPGSELRTPCFFVGDEAFPLSPTMMRPYPGRGLSLDKKIFNYRLSRARRTIENAFGILLSRWRIFRRPIALHPEFVDDILLATICLQRFSTESQQHKLIQLVSPDAHEGRPLRNQTRSPSRRRVDILFCGMRGYGCILTCRK